MQGKKKRCAPLLMCLAFLPTSALAQDRDAMAEALYNSALALMEEGKDAEACPKLEQSQKLDPAVGTLLYLGLCYERIGKTASAWAAYRSASEASRKANQPERRKIALERAEKIEPLLSTVTLQLPGGGPAGLSIVFDEAPLGVASLGVPIPVDPGSHTLEVGAPGHESRTIEISIGAGGEKKLVTIEPLDASTAASVPPPVAPADGPDGAPAERDEVSSSSSQKIIGVVVGGVGLVGLAAGSYFAIHSGNKQDDAKADCANYPNDCNDTGIAANDEAKDAARNANIAFILGGAALVGGIVLYATAPAEPSGASYRLTPAVGSKSGGLVLSGRW